MKLIVRIVALWFLALGLAGCSDQPPLLKTTGDDYPEKLSDWRIHKVSKQSLKLNTGVVPYDLNTPLFTDYASKLRTVWVPEGKTAEASGDDIVYPVGTIISKTFYYPLAGDGDRSRVSASEGGPVLYKQGRGLPLDKVHLVETRVLVKQQQGWVALPYYWNEEQTEATLEWAGESKQLTLVKADGREETFPYIVPDANQCAGCHAPEENRRMLKPLGPKPRHLNRDFVYATGTENQLAYWQKLGVLEGIDNPETAPQNALWPVARPGESLEKQARSYLDANCSHCHNPAGAARTSGLFLSLDTPWGTKYGVCKRPIAAGKGTGNRIVSILPGKAEGSIVTYRMVSKDPGEMMPELGRSLAHQEGVELIEQWINSLPPEC